MLVQVEIDIDDKLILSNLEAERQHVFETLVRDINVDVYPMLHHVCNVIDDVNVLNSMNNLIEYYGGKKKTFFEMYTAMGEKQKHPVHDEPDV